MVLRQVRYLGGHVRCLLFCIIPKTPLFGEVGTLLQGKQSAYSNPRLKTNNNLEIKKNEYQVRILGDVKSVFKVVLVT